MATASAVLQSLRGTAPTERTELGWRDNFITILFGLWLMLGLFVDGWAHNNLEELETFFTPWHALFYSGFLVNAAWIGWLILREWRKGRVGLAAIPRGYHLGLLGVFIFGAGGVGDMLWHTIFGIEMNIEALLSPTHLMLFLGGSLVFASPFAAAWGSDDPAGDVPTLGAFLPPVASITLMMSFASFMNMYLWGFWTDAHIQPFARFAVMEKGLADILITNAILLAPVLLLLRRWQIPFGTVTFLWTLNTVLMGALQFYPVVDPIVIALLSGLIADGLIQILKPWPSRLAAFRAVAVSLPLILWTMHFVAAQLRWGLGWSLELTAGITVMAALSGLVLSLLMAPPAIPDRLAAR